LTVSVIPSVLAFHEILIFTPPAIPAMAKGGEADIV